MRLFLVGCSRSGTTLLQKILAGHSRMHTFPETAFFLRARETRHRTAPWARIGLTRGKEYRNIRKLLRAVDRADLLASVPWRRFLLRQSVADFVRIADRLTADAGKDIWLEKTPRHFRQADFIMATVPAAQIIHLVRDGREVVASLYDRALSYPDKFGKQRDLRTNIRLWNHAVETTYRHLGAEGHHAMVYEALIDAPEAVTRRLCRELGLDFQPAMLEANESYFLKANEAWKEKVRSSDIRGESKFHRLFDAPTRDWITRQLLLDRYEAIRRYCNALGDEAGDDASAVS